MGEALGSLGINPTFLLSQALNFLLLFGVLTALLWKPAMRRLEARREMVRKQREDAEAVAQARGAIEQERAQMLDEARAEANRILTEARGQARQIIEQATTQGRQEAEQFLIQARQEAEAERAQLLGQMREQIVALAIAAAHRLVGEALDEQRQRALVAAFFSGVHEGRVEILPEEMPAEGPVVVTSAVPLTETDASVVRRELAARLGREPEVTFRVDPAVLGGLVVRIGDRVVDGSFAGQLEQMRRALAE